MLPQNWSTHSFCLKSTIAPLSSPVCRLLQFTVSSVFRTALLVLSSRRRRLTTSLHSSRPSIGFQLKNALRTRPALSPTSACTTLLHNTSLPVFTAMCHQERYSPPLTLSCTKYQEQTFLLLDSMPSLTPVQHPGIVFPHHCARQHHRTPLNAILKRYQPFLCQIAGLLRVSLVRHTCMHIGFLISPLPFPQAPSPPPCPRLEPILTIGIRRTINRVIIIIYIMQVSTSLMGVLPLWRNAEKEELTLTS